MSESAAVRGIDKGHLGSCGIGHCGSGGGEGLSKRCPELVALRLTVIVVASGSLILGVMVRVFECKL